MPRYSLNDMVLVMFATLIVISAITINGANIISSNNIDLRYQTVWSLDVSGIERVASLIDYSSDGVNDVVGIGNYTVVFIDGLNGSLIYNYTVENGFRIYTMTPLADINGNGFNEIAIISINGANRTIKMDLVEPATSSILLTQNYTLPDPNEYSLIPAVQNGILDNGILSVIVSGIKIIQSFPPRIIAKTWIYKFDLVNGIEQPVEVIDGRAYTLWTNQIPSDDDGDGYIEILSSITTKGYIRFEVSIIGITLYGGIEVKEPIYQWSDEGTNRIPITVFKPYSIVGRLVVGYVIVSFTGGSITVDSVRFIGYQLGTGSQKYTINLDYDTYLLHGLSIAGNSIVIDLINRIDNDGLCRFYDGDSGYLLREIDLGGYDGGSITTMSIGDIDNDNNIEILIAFNNKVYLTSISEDLDYLGNFSNPIYINDGSIIFNGNETYYALLVKAEDFQRIYTITIIENDTTPPFIKILYPANNTVISTPFNIVTRVEEDLSRIVNVSLKIYFNNTLVTEIPMNYDPSSGIAHVLVNDLGDGEYELVIEALNSNGLRGSNRTHVIIDNTNPVIDVYSNPPNGSRVLNELSLSIIVDDVSFNNITILVNNQFYSVIHDSSVNITLDLSPYPDGYVNITIYASDRVGHVSFKELKYWKDSAPPVIIVTGISNHTIAYGVLGIELMILDNTSAYTLVYLDNELLSEFEGIGSYNISINTTLYPDGNHSIKIVSIDHMGLDTSLQTIVTYLFIIDNNAPIISISNLSEYSQLGEYKVYVIPLIEYSLNTTFNINIEDITLRHVIINIIYIDGNETTILLEANKSLNYKLTLPISMNRYVARITIEAKDLLNRSSIKHLVIIGHLMKPLANLEWSPDLNTTVGTFRNNYTLIFNSDSVELTMYLLAYKYSIEGIGEVFIPVKDSNIVIYRYLANDTMIIRNIHVTIDNWTTPLTIDLSKGIYVINISIIDFLGINNTVKYLIAVDTGPPSINKFNISLQEASINIVWDVSDDLWVDKILLEIDNTSYEVQAEGSMEIELSPGKHSIRIIAYDPLNRSASLFKNVVISQVTKTPTITPPTETIPTTPTSPSIPESTFPTTPSGDQLRNVIIIVLIILIIGVYMVYRWKYRK